jgi:4-hydroxy-2-oxoheptanedioate aldolase
MKQNIALQKMRTGKTAIGTFLVIASPDQAERICTLGYDFVILDWQHGEWTDATVSAALGRLIDQKTTPLVRVRNHDQGLINWVLDMGALGVVVPMVENAGQAKAITATAYYPPRGTRSIGGNRLARMTNGNFAEYSAHANDEILVVAMVETKPAIDNVEEIMAVDGIGAIMIGPGDLMIDVKARGLDETDHAKLIDDVATASKKSSVAAGPLCQNAENAIERSGQGFRFIVIGSDQGVVTAGMQATLDAVKSIE